MCRSPGLNLMQCLRLTLKAAEAKKKPNKWDSWTDEQVFQAVRSGEYTLSRKAVWGQGQKRYHAARYYPGDKKLRSESTTSSTII